MWAEGGVLINYADTTKFCIKELYLFVNIHVNILKGTVHIFKVCIMISGMTTTLQLGQQTCLPL